MQKEADDEAKRVGKKADVIIQEHGLGINGYDFSENFACSTQAALCSFLHWSRSLGTQAAKDSSIIAFDRFLEKCLGGVKRVWVVSPDIPAGTVSTTGVQVVVEGSTIRDASGLCTAFPSLKAAIARKKDKPILLEPDDLDGHRGS